MVLETGLGRALSVRLHPPPGVPPPERERRTRRPLAGHERVAGPVGDVGEPHRRVEEQETAIVELKSTMAEQRQDFEAAITQQQKTFQSRFAEQEKQIAALESGLQEVSARFNASKPAARFVSAISR